jgi:hypothetical protein
MNLYEAFDAFTDVERCIIIKSDVLRLGLKFSERALEACQQRTDILFKGYRIFSYDFEETVVYGQKMPYVIFLEDGTADGTCIQIRSSGKSPYAIDLEEDGTFALYFDNQAIGKIHFARAPLFYQQTINGIPMPALVSAHSDLLYVAVNKHCDFFSQGMQCLFCDLTPHAATQKKGETMILRKDPELTAEVLKAALGEHCFRHIFISGGTFLKGYEGLTEVEWYAQFLEKIRKRIGCWYTATFQIQALPDEGWKRLYDTGIPSVQPNIEVWDKELFKIVCPGKAKYVGYEEWIKRTVRAVDFWGPGNVNPNFVSGIEMAQPFGFKDVNKAVESTLSGFDFLMSNGVLPRQGDFWCVEAGSKLAGQEPPPLEYFVKLGKGYLELREKHGFMTCAPYTCRFDLLHGTECDFEYWHGNGPRSRKAQEAGGILYDFKTKTSRVAGGDHGD